MGLNSEIVQFIKKRLLPPYNSIENYERFFMPYLQFHSALCTTTIATLNQILVPLIEAHSERFFCRVDDSHPIKSPVSVIEKILRSEKEAREKQADEKETSTEYDLANFYTSMTDLARFRIVCNFLTDVEEVSHSIEQSKDIENFFVLYEISNTIRQHKRKSGERSIKIVLKQIRPPNLFLEIQIMTQLQEAWDKKDHYLVYEKRRSSSHSADVNFPTYLDEKMFAMAELLYVADDYVDMLRKEEEMEVYNK